MSVRACLSFVRVTSVVAATVASLFVLSATPAHAQVASPATEGQPQTPPPVQTPPPQTPPPDTHLRTFEMFPVTVYGTAPIKEEDLIGDYQQPRWTAARRFGETRVYVIPKGVAEFEYRLIPERGRDGKVATQSLYKVEFGLPHRFQLDVYAVGDQAGKDGTFALDGQKVEVRYAFADWGKIWGNPTIYLEWKDLSNQAPHFEGKMLLGGQITSRWHWGSDLVWEHTLGDTHENSNEWTTGLSYAVADTKASVGIETQVALVNHETVPNGNTRTPFTHEFLIGPSIQFRPLPQVHIDFAPLFGATHDASRVKVFMIFGWEF